MKVISVKEPYASLIKEGIKCIETRSWKTNYRGILYIHASLKEMKEYNNKEKILDFLKDVKLNCGYIICKCRLVDCVYMDEDFINKIRENEKEFICGDYQVGRYAWILEDVVPLDNIIRVNGKLGIWNYE